MKKYVNIYFAAEIRRSNNKIYKKIIGYLELYGRVLTKHIACDNIGEAHKEAFPKEKNITPKKILNKIKENLRQADALVAEVSGQSFGGRARSGILH